MSEYIGIITQTIYGESGDETPPPVRERKEYGYINRSGETQERFYERLLGIVAGLRKSAADAPRKPYSQRDGWDWRIVVVREVPHAAE